MNEKPGRVEAGLTRFRALDVRSPLALARPDPNEIWFSLRFEPLRTARNEKTSYVIGFDEAVTFFAEPFHDTCFFA
jgi:hypothetical protein